MREIGLFLCATGLLAFIFSSAAYIIHRYVIMKRIVRKKLDENLWDDPDFDYKYYYSQFK